jgi:hypothetical protein
MLSKKIFTQEYISELRGRTGDDPLMIERTLFAFGLLEAIKSVDMPFDIPIQSLSRLKTICL